MPAVPPDRSCRPVRSAPWPCRRRRAGTPSPGCPGAGRRWAAASPAPSRRSRRGRGGRRRGCCSLPGRCRSTGGWRSWLVAEVARRRVVGLVGGGGHSGSIWPASRDRRCGRRRACRPGCRRPPGPARPAAGRRPAAASSRSARVRRSPPAPRTAGCPEPSRRPRGRPRPGRRRRRRSTGCAPRRRSRSARSRPVATSTSALIRMPRRRRWAGRRRPDRIGGRRGRGLVSARRLGRVHGVPGVSSGMAGSGTRGISCVTRIEFTDPMGPVASGSARPPPRSGRFRRRCRRHRRRSP